MPDITAQHWTIALLILLAAYTFRGVTGFGSGIIAIPLLALFLPLPLVVPLIGLLDVSASLLHGWRHRRLARWDVLKPLFPWTLLGVIIALYVFNTLDSAILVKLLGSFVLLFALYSLLLDEPALRPARSWSVAAGLSGGLVGTLFGTGGPFYVIYLHIYRLNKGEFRATVATLFAIDGSMRVAGYTASGFYGTHSLTLALAGIPLMLAALWAGGRIHTRISQRTFQRATGILLLASGTALLLK
jgi:uncharacterized membrane protein YfcA